MKIVLVTPPAVEPLTTAEAKDHLRVEHASDDTYINALIVAARRHIEHFTRRALITQTWDLVLDAFPAPEPRCNSHRRLLLPDRNSAVELARGALQSVTSVKYVDSAGVEQTLDPAKYFADTASTPGQVLPAYGERWPVTRDQANAVKIRFVAGYGDATAVPGDVKQALLLLIGQMYEHREPEITGTIVSRFTFAAEALLAPHRVHTL